jgi:hypothetical protein
MSKMYIRVDDETEENTSGGRLSGKREKLPPGIREIDSAQLADKMQELSEQLTEVFGKVENVGKFKLSKVELGIEISGEGGINLIANGKVVGKGAIKMVFEPDS